MNKPITNRVRNGAWGKDAVHQPELKTGTVSPAKETGEGNDEAAAYDASGAQLTSNNGVSFVSDTPGTEEIIPGKTTIKESTYDGPLMSAEEWNKLTPEQKRKMNAAVGADKDGIIRTEVKEPDQVIKTPGEKSQYTGYIERTGDAITPWENRWNRKVEKQQDRWKKQEAKKDLRNIAKQEARNIRQEGGTWAEGWKGRRDVMTGRAELSAKEQELYNVSRGIDASQQNVHDTRLAEAQLKGLDSGNDHVGGVFDKLGMQDMGTADGVATSGRYEDKFGGAPTPGNKTTSGSSTPEATESTGLSGRKAQRAFDAEKAANTKVNLKSKTADLGKEGATKLANTRSAMPTQDKVLEGASNWGFKQFGGKKGATELAPTFNEKPIAPPSEQASSGFDVPGEKKILGSESAAKMRYQANVGMKGKSPLKKGYFK